MGRRCSLQEHPERFDIDTLIRQGRSIRYIADLKGVSPGSVQRHAAHIDTCLPVIDTAIDTVIDTPGNISIQSVAPAGESIQYTDTLTSEWIQFDAPAGGRFDRLEMSLASLHGRFDTLDAGIMEIWKRIEGLLGSVPDEPAPTRIDTPELDTDGMSPVEAMRVLTRDIQRVFRQTPRKEHGPVMRVLQDGLQGLASGEECSA